MDGYQYLVQRNRLMIELADRLAKLAELPEAERVAEKKKLEAEFDRNLADLYAKVAGEFPGERKKKARPLSDPQ
ncbi:MAG TPA: hypothetical protein VEC38_01735 [Candidatus Binataceae bacterium]|nr:hypothetical protein [Candidatus Binataceae bacterium]